MITMLNIQMLPILQVIIATVSWHRNQLQLRHKQGSTTAKPQGSWCTAAQSESSASLESSFSTVRLRRRRRFAGALGFGGERFLLPRPLLTTDTADAWKIILKNVTNGTSTNEKQKASTTDCTDDCSKIFLVGVANLALLIHCCDNWP